MSFLNKIFHRQKHPPINVRIFDQHSLLTNTDIKKIRQIARTYYRGPESETTVVREIKKATGLKVGNVTLEYEKSKNVLNIFYCTTR